MTGIHQDDNPETIPTGMQPLDYETRPEPKSSGSALLKIAVIAVIALVGAYLLRR